MNRRSRFKIILVLISFALFSNFQCNDCEDELHDSSSYTATIVPLQKSYALGDTITIGASMSAMIELQLGGTTRDQSNQDVQFVIQLFEMNPDNEMVTKGIESFSMFSKIGSLEMTSSSFDRKLARGITNTCDTELCEFEVGVIPMKKGIFGIGLLSSRILETDCEFLTFVSNEFENDDNNFSICKQINTEKFRLLQSGAFYSMPEDIPRFYFFEVE